MQLPQFALPRQDVDDGSGHATNNPILINLLNNMSIMKQLYAEFLKLHAQAFLSKHPNSNFSISAVQTQIQKHPNSIAFATGFMGIMSIINEIDFTNQMLLHEQKLRIFQLVTNCESHFFNFNQLFPPTPELLQSIHKISVLFIEIKKELNQLGLYAMPGTDLNQAVPTPNPAALQVHDREDSAQPDHDARVFKGRRIQ